GEVRVRYPDIHSMAAAMPFSWSLFAGTVLTCVTLIMVAGFVSHHWMLHVREAAETARCLARGETSTRCRRRVGGAIHDLQANLHDLGKSLAEGDIQARSSLVELGQQMVELLERRGLKGHAERTCRYAMILAGRLGLTSEETRDLELAARLHDLGEAWLRPSLLDKNGPLDDGERACLRSLPDRGASILGRLPSLRRVAEIIRRHREKFDGSGYPDGLRGERIPLGARIVAIADAYDQLTTCASDGPPLAWPQALDRLQEDRGEHFDPWLLDLFEEEIRKAPVPEPRNQVMISQAGVLPYKAAQEDWLIDRVPADEDDDLSTWAETGLDVVSEDAPAGDAVEDDCA
ncbi:MAG: HD-GYP domain-containing protein, partial [Planctomycetota bacterium]